MDDFGAVFQSLEPTDFDQDVAPLQEEYEMKQQSCADTPFLDDLKVALKAETPKPFTCEVRLSLRNAFSILVDSLYGDFDASIPIREGASPIHPSETCFYVCGKGKRPRGKKRRLETSQPISVKYSSLNPKNCEVWWSPDYGHLLGVVSRSMSKVARPTNSNSKNAKARFHGYGGRLFSLVRRTDISDDKQKNMKSFLVSDAPGLVQFWKLEKGKADSLVETQSIISSGSSVTASSSPSPGEESHALAHRYPGDVSINGDLVVDGELSVRNLHVKGNLLVEGSISGQLVTPPGSADYAEWFAFLDKDENIGPGMVIQLRSPEQKITLDTSGSGPHMVVSTTPSVAAGVPPSIGGEEPIRGSLCAFLGQVPVNVVGPVQCGQYLFPSGKNDGYAIAATYKDYSRENEPLGTAMESCPAGKHQVLSFIRWQHNLKFQVLKQKKEQIHQATVNHWLSGFVGLLENCFTLCYLYQRSLYNFEMIMCILSIGLYSFAISHFPNYSQYWIRGDFLYFLLCAMFRFSIAVWILGGIVLSPGFEDTDMVQRTMQSFIVVISEYYRLNKHAALADGHLWRGKYRKELLAWRLYDGVQKSIHRSILKRPTNGEQSPLGILLNVKDHVRWSRGSEKKID